ncbi:hypothetical protein OPQ81_005770 [Rhizoctonia solani]|nr:hypothetical protein OPQ81_005770 [Rhizoctonia solani]
MSSLFESVFGCCLRHRSRSDQPDEHSPLIPEPIVPIENTSTTTEDPDLKEQLFAAHREAASRMVNVESDHPFVMVPVHDSSYSHSDSRSPSRSSSQHPDYGPRPMSPDHHEGEEETDADVFRVGIEGIRFLRPDVMRGRTGGSKENTIPMPGEGLSSYDTTQIPTPTQPIRNPLDAPLTFKGKPVVRDFPPVHQVMGGNERDYYD